MADLRRLGGRVARRVRGAPTPQKKQNKPAYGPKPEVVEETTRLGAAMDRLVARARSNQRRIGVNEDYDLVRDNFDHYAYLLQAPAGAHKADTDPIRHFLWRGARAGSSPDVNFSMEAYLERYPHHADGPERSPYLEWLKRGRAAGELADPALGLESLAGVLGVSPRELAAWAAERRSDVWERMRTGRLGEMFAKAVEVEPLVAEAWPEATRPKPLPLGVPEEVLEQVSLTHACHAQAGWRPARVVIATGGRPSDAGLINDLAEALEQHVPAEEIVVLLTDEPADAAVRLPDGVRVVDFTSAASPLVQGARLRALVTLLRSYWADSVVNLDSDLLHEAMAVYGRALVASEHLYVFLTAHRENSYGWPEGWGMRTFYATFEWVDGVIVDSADYRDWLIAQYAVPDGLDRFHLWGASPEGSGPTVAERLLCGRKQQEAPA